MKNCTRFFFRRTQVNDDVNFEAFCNSLSWETHADAMAATLIVPAWETHADAMAATLIVPANTMRSNNNCSTD